jgi:hypothetical protein
MLAIKFHHLRCLVHRPFLGLSSFQRSKIHSALLICVSEARKIVHLLHNVFDERSLLYDFPWWQMIPCLVCASSVLLSASIQVLKGHSIEAGELQAETLHEDAETCLKVFDSLSANFNAARQAMNMMKDLKNLQMTVNCMFCVPLHYCYSPRLLMCVCSFLQYLKYNILVFRTGPVFNHKRDQCQHVRPNLLRRGRRRGRNELVLADKLCVGLTELYYAGSQSIS